MKLPVPFASRICHTLLSIYQSRILSALVVKLVNTADLKSAAFTGLPVQVRPSAPLQKNIVRYCNL